MRKTLSMLTIGILIAVSISGCLENKSTENTPPESNSETPSYLPDFMARFSYETTGLGLYVNGLYSIINLSFEQVINDITWQWDFGDGTTDENEDYCGLYYSSHTYKEPGNYTVRLTTSYESKQSYYSQMIDVKEGKKSLFIPSEVPSESANGTKANKWAILCSICTEKYTKFGFESDYFPGIRTLAKIGFPWENIIFLEGLAFKKSHMIEALNYVRNQSDFANATVVIYIVAHGGCLPTPSDYPKDGKLHSYIQLYDESADALADENAEWKDALIYDYELKEMFEGYEPAKFLFTTVACESGFMTGEDTTGQLQGITDALFDSLGAPGRIIITGSTAPLLTSGGVMGYGFWEYGLGEGRGDTNPGTGNNDGKTSVEEAFYYCKTMANAEGTLTASSQPCMNDQYPSDNPDEEMFI